MYQSKEFGKITAERLEELNGSELARLFNETAETPVKRFKDRETALRRVKAQLNGLVTQEPKPAKKQKREPAGPLNLPQAKEIGSHRPSTNRGKVILRGLKAEGVSWEELQKLTGWDHSRLRSSLIAINKQLGHGVVEKDGRIYLSGEYQWHKPVNLPAKEEQRPIRENTKRAAVFSLLNTKEGATVEEVQQITGWDTKQALEGIKLLNIFCGYGLKQDSNGCIRIVK